ncbi:hypothetical protein DFH09DRAFT_1106073 [Mycena vulgaris]|nr:hypothetical protein DFH09DRAFT_1106073 [Mycena vulgaris]
MSERTPWILAETQSRVRAICDTAGSESSPRTSAVSIVGSQRHDSAPIGTLRLLVGCHGAQAVDAASERYVIPRDAPGNDSTVRRKGEERPRATRMVTLGRTTMYLESAYKLISTSYKASRGKNAFAHAPCTKSVGKRSGMGQCPELFSAVRKFREARRRPPWEELGVGCYGGERGRRVCEDFDCAPPCRQYCTAAPRESAPLRSRGSAGSNTGVWKERTDTCERPDRRKVTATDIPKNDSQRFPTRAVETTAGGGRIASYEYEGTLERGGGGGGGGGGDSRAPNVRRMALPREGGGDNWATKMRGGTSKKEAKRDEEPLRCRHDGGRRIGTSVGAGADVGCREGGCGLSLGGVEWRRRKGGGEARMSTPPVGKGAAVNARANDEWTALHLAADKGYTELVRFLVQEGTDVDARGISFSNPLGQFLIHAASQKNIIGNWLVGHFAIFIFEAVQSDKLIMIYGLRNEGIHPMYGLR